jgi:hypothetical protein
MSAYTVVWSGASRLLLTDPEGWQQKSSPLAQMRASIASMDDGDALPIVRRAVPFPRCGCGKPIRKSGVSRCFTCREKDCRVRRRAA